MSTREYTDYMDKSLVFVDIETTGGSPYRDRVLDIAAIRVENSVETDRFVSLVNPDRRIPYFITDLTGISQYDVVTSPSFAEVAPVIEAIMQDAIFVAHNVWFDYGFLREEFRELGMTFAPPLACTVRLSRRLFPGLPSHRLDAVIERHNIVVENRHRALGDALAIQEFYRQVVASHGIEAVQAALRPRQPMAHE